MDDKIKILITGGSGYLAVNIANLLKTSFKITLVTRNPEKIKLRHKNIKIKKISYTQKDLINCSKKHDVVIHLVGTSSAFSSSNKKVSMSVKSSSTKNLVKACNKNNISNIIYASSIKVYQNFDKKNINNESHIKENKDIYALSHLCGEKIILTESNPKINVKILRLSNVFGLNSIHKSTEASNNLVNSFCNNGLNLKSIFIKNPNIVRNFLPLNMLVKIISLIINNKIKKNIKIINVGYKSFTLYEIASLVKLRIKKLYKIDIEIFNNQKIFKRKKILYKSQSYNNLYKKKIFLSQISKTLKLLYEKKNN